MKKLISLLMLLCFFSVVKLLSADEPVDKLSLAIIERAGFIQSDLAKNTELSVLHDFGDLLLVEIASSFEDYTELERLKITILSQYQSSQSVFLVTGKEELEREFREFDSNLVYERDKIGVLVTEPSIISSYDFTGYRLTQLHKVITTEFPEEHTPQTFLYYQPEVISRPEIEDLTAQLSVESWIEAVSRLEDFGSRYFLHPNRYEVVDWLVKEFESYGLSSVVADSFYIDEYAWGNFPSVWQSNVIATIPGSVYPESYLVMGAHYDSIVSQYLGDPMEFAPGADDNASGVAALLQIAEVLTKSNYTPAKTLKFVAFGAEEIGLKGSSYLAEKMRRDDKKIELMLNNDMIAYQPNEDDEWKVKIYPYNNSLYLSELASEIFKGFTTLIPQFSTVNNPASDSYPFWKEGFPSIFFHEYIFNPYYHSSEDLLINCNPDYALEIVKASLLKLIYFDSIPTAIDNLQISDSGTGNSISLEWFYPCCSDVNHYNIYLGTSSENYFRSYTISSSYLEIEDLTEDNDYYIGISAVNNRGFEGPVTEFIFTPMSVPRMPKDFEVKPSRDYLHLVWRENTEADLAGYNIYRSQTREIDHTKPYQTISQHNEFFDYNVEPKEFYYYSLRAVDNLGRESEPTVILKSRLFSLDQGIVIVNLAKEGDGSHLLPYRADSFRFYDSVMPNYSFDYLAVETELELLDLIPYSLTIIVNDNILPIGYSDRFETILAEYLDRGGKLMLTGFKPLQYFSKDEKYPIEFEADSFPYRYLQVKKADHKLGSLFNRAIPSADYPVLEIDATKISPELDSHIINIISVEPLFEQSIIYRYGTKYDISEPSGSLANRPVGLTSITGNSKVALLSFPLYYTNENSARNFTEHILADFFEEKNWQETVAIDDKVHLKIFPNYPNPFRNLTTIPYYLSQDSDIEIVLYNIRGQKVKRLYRGNAVAGRHKLIINTEDKLGGKLPTGLYLCSLSSRNHRSVQKIIIAR